MTQNKTQPTDDGVRIDLMREAQMQGMGSTEKVRYIIDRIRDSHVVVLESGLEPDEQSLLIEMTMTEIDQDEFTGIEVETYPDETQQSNNGGLLGRLVERTTQRNTTPDPALTVIGPADQMETLHKDEKQISALLNP